MVTPFSIAFLPEIYFGQNTLLKLPDLAKRFGNKVILVTGKNSFLQSDYGQKLLSDLKNKNLTVELLSVSSEPTVTLIDDAVIEVLELTPAQLRARKGYNQEMVAG